MNGHECCKNVESFALFILNQWTVWHITIVIESINSTLEQLLSWRHSFMENMTSWNPMLIVEICSKIEWQHNLFRTMAMSFDYYVISIFEFWLQFSLIFKRAFLLLVVQFEFFDFYLINSRHFRVKMWIQWLLMSQCRFNDLRSPEAGFLLDQG